MNAQTSTAERTGELRSLFARVSRKARVVVPINDAAADPKNTAPAFFCVHSLSGAGGTDFIALANRVGDGLRIFGVQAPPKRIDEPMFGATVPSIAAIYADALSDAQPAGPIHLGGWSAGAPIALEVAHQLRRLGREVGLLVAIEGGPEIAHDGVRRWDPRYWLRVAANAPAWWRDTRSMKPDFPLGDAIRFARSIGARVRRGGGRGEGRVRASEHIEQFGSMDRYPAAQRQFMVRLYDAIMQYEPAPWDAPVVVYEASIKPAATLPQYLERWRMIAPQAERVVLDGNHVTIMREPWVGQLAGDLKRRIGTTEAAA
ncbi:MAG TPA: thioesterase domain-containing protein [Caulobacteraceae bacterium]|nr:thioesterase domain-containing protein [Caulobacteraceae bacterium]